MHGFLWLLLAFWLVMVVAGIVKQIRMSPEERRRANKKRKGFIPGDPGGGGGGC
ncbi:hypothetical protein LHJ74_27395 [Streptomyces sp. N2-109]|uniref:Uncharacterized protein n=1 Tax=Streptomyces gossypii TaxID=2883101 RepID=A0ABT2K0A8_9ACTN|nr:hypothetical protein [Streptomyces gossypii]MCT2593585.1 hypothetical protein [Streptomyces gossypii]